MFFILVYIFSFDSATIDNRFHRIIQCHHQVWNRLSIVAHARQKRTFVDPIKVLFVEKYKSREYIDSNIEVSDMHLPSLCFTSVWVEPITFTEATYWTASPTEFNILWYLNTWFIKCFLLFSNTWSVLDFSWKVNHKQMFRNEIIRNFLILVYYSTIGI